MLVVPGIKDANTKELIYLPYIYGYFSSFVGILPVSVVSGVSLSIPRSDVTWEESADPADYRRSAFRVCDGVGLNATENLRFVAVPGLIHALSRSNVYPSKVVSWFVYLKMFI